MEIVDKNKFKKSFWKFYFSFPTLTLLCELLLFVLFFALIGYGVKEEISVIEVYSLITILILIIVAHFYLLRKSWLATLDISNNNFATTSIQGKTIKLSLNNIISIVHLRSEKISLLIYHGYDALMPSVKAKKVLVIDMTEDTKVKLLKCINQNKEHSFSNFYSFFLKHWTH